MYNNETGTKSIIRAEIRKIAVGRYYTRGPLGDDNFSELKRRNRVISEYMRKDECIVVVDIRRTLPSDNDKTSGSRRWVGGLTLRDLIGLYFLRDKKPLLDSVCTSGREGFYGPTDGTMNVPVGGCDAIERGAVGSISSREFAIRQIHCESTTYWNTALIH